VRPSDWFLVGLPVDPTPGDAFGIRALAQKYADIAQIAGEASTGVRNARSSGSASAWVGDAAEVFRDRSSRMPGELLKANDSYQTVADALRAWAESVDDTQAQADRGLQHAREAAADRTRAMAALGAAELSWTTVHAQQLTYQTLQKAYSILPPPPGVTMPTDYQLRSVARNAQHAQASIASAQHAISDADARLAAARRLVLDAKATRDDAERRTVHQVHEAQGQAVKPSSVWEAIQSSAAWQAIVVIATVVLTIVSIVAIFVGGPLVWALIIAATVLLIVNALMSIAQGKDAWGELIMLGIGLIPGGRFIGLAAKGVDLLARAGAVGARIAGAIRAVTALVLRLGAGTVRVVQALGERVVGAAAELGSRAALALRVLAVKASLAAHLTFGGIGEHVESASTNLEDLWAMGNHLAGPAHVPTEGALGHYFSDLDQPHTPEDLQQYVTTFINPDGSFAYPPMHGFENGVSAPREFVPGTEGEPNVLVRIGDEGGGYLAPYGTTFQQSALPFSEINPYDADFAVKFYAIEQKFSAQFGHIAPVSYTTPGGTQLLLDSALPGAANGMWKVEQLVAAGILRRIEDLGTLPSIVGPTPVPLILQIPGL